MHNDKNSFMSKARIAMYLVVLAAMFGLAACGGGGGGSSTGTAADPTTPTTPVVQQWEQPVTSVPAPTYAAGSAELAIFTKLNQIRSAAGVGLLAQNANIDTATAAYINYTLVNINAAGFVFNDMEIASLPGFTGVGPEDRMTAAGFAGSGTQVADSGGATNPLACFDLLLNAVYHRLAMLDGYTAVGVAYGQGIDTFGGNNTLTANCAIDLATPSTLNIGQVPVAPVVYPYQGQTAVGPTFMPAAETPNAAPDLGTETIGTPITVSLWAQSLMGANLTGFNASNVTITAFTITQQGSTAPLAARIVTGTGVQAGPGVTLTTDVNPGYINQYVDYLLPLTPLASATTYNVVFSATVNGQAVNLSWSFTTGTRQPDGTFI